ncbi:zinc finger protein 184 [Dermacentor silvarum]|uniref:zinc finger protein 184 n=1 Tax=Dermacentor silvarum TaxID=543639 RepID=UPI002101BB9A|nr:zinc finger protein 184 [Dermacentor silvarum]
MEEEQPSQQEKLQEEGATMQGLSDSDMLQLCKQLQEIRARLAKARAKAQVDSTVQDKAAAKLDEVCELLQRENLSDCSTCPKDGTSSANNASTMTEDDAVNAVIVGPACGPSCCAANETVGGDDASVSSAVIVDTANLDVACETVSTTDYCVVTESPSPAKAGGVRNSVSGSSPCNEDHCYAAGLTSSDECILPDTQVSFKFVHQSSEKRPAPADTQTPDAKKAKTTSSVSSETSLKSRVIVAGAPVPSGTPGPVIVRRCILQPAGANITQTMRNSSLPIASQSRVTMLVKAKDAGKPIRVPVHMYPASNQQSGASGTDSPQKLTIVHMKVLQQPPQTSKTSTGKQQKSQKTVSKGCQTTRITRAQTRKKAARAEVEQEPCTALVKTFPQPDKRKGRRKGKNAMTTQCVVFCCEACGDAFSAAKHLHRHWQTRHRKKQEGKHQCSYCTYSSDRKAHVTMHERTHTGERPFSCYVCQKGFYRADDVETHMRVHTKEKPFECDECGQRFNKVHLKSHMRTHTGERPYQCSQCNQRFTELGSVRKHERMVHAGDYPHYCPHCGKGLANNFKLKKHLRARHFQFKMEDYVDEEEQTPETVKAE